MGFLVCGKSENDRGIFQIRLMGIKGFKIDFMDRDDQKMVSSLYRIAQESRRL